MELVSDDDGRVIHLKEGQRQELGRGPGGGGAVPKEEQSVSRRHALVELLRPSSRKGKEVVGEFAALRLYVRVVGRNPICCITGREGRGGGGLEGKDDAPSHIKFLGRGEDEWLSTGDKVALSIRRPSFWTLRPSSRNGQTLRGADNRGGESLSSLRNAIPAVRSNSNGPRSPVEKGGDRDVEDSSPLDEEAEIAKAVARRQRRTLEREEEEQRKRLQTIEQHQQEQHQHHQRRRSEIVAELDNHGATDTNAEAHKEASVLKPCQQSNGLPNSFDPVSEFGFVVEGAEFQSYEKRSKTAHPGEWSWSIDTAKGGDEEGDRIVVQERRGRSNGTSGKNSRASGEEEGQENNQEWGGDSKEEAERIAKVAGIKRGGTISTRSNRRQNADSRSGSATLNPQHRSKRSSGTARTKDDEDMSDFVVSDDESTEGGDLSDFIVSENDSIEEEDDDDEDDTEDDDKPVPRQKAKGSAQKPVCKYGSNCYRKNAEHLAQFSHPPR